MPRGTRIINRNNTTGPAPRAGIVASKDINMHALGGWCTRDCAVAIATIHGRNTVIASIYLDIQLPPAPQWLEDLLNMANNKGLPILLGIDTNAHSSLYGPDNNHRGDAIENLIISQGLRVLNTGTAPTFETRRGTNTIQTHIDVTLARDLHFDITDWRVDRSYNGSDHNTILFGAPATETTPHQIRPWSRADWDVFRTHLSNTDYRIPVNMSMKKLDKLTTRLYDALETALEAACPLTTVKPTIQTNNWATEKHAAGKKKVSDLYKRAKNTDQEQDWLAYKQADKAFKHTCKRDRNKAWREYKESLQTHKDMASLARLAQREDRHEVNSLTRPDGTTADPGQETIDALAGAHFPASTNKQRVTYNNRRNCLTASLDDKYNDWITQEKIRRALTGFVKRKAPGQTASNLSYLSTSQRNSYVY